MDLKLAVTEYNHTYTFLEITKKLGVDRKSLFYCFTLFNTNILNCLVILIISYIKNPI